VVDVVRTLFCKYDGRPHRQVQSIRLGEDEYGLWVGSLPGGLGRRGDGRWVAIEHHRVRLFPHNAWWSALFNDEPHETEIYCDISTKTARRSAHVSMRVADLDQFGRRDRSRFTTPAEISDNTVTTVDLDLDIRRMRDGTVRVVDKEEFAVHRVKYNYPDRVVDAARATCAWVAANITTAEPFRSAYRHYLDRVRDLTPIR
jgi:uncharacterized protein